MERRIHLNVSKKNAFTWIMVVLLCASAVCRLLPSFSAGLPFWGQILLPLAATVLFIGIVLIGGKEMFYKTAIPVWMICLYFALSIRDLGFGAMVNWLWWVVLLFFAVLYTEITSTKGNLFGLLPLLFLTPLSAMGYLHRADLVAAA
jgi:hypothetical protein